MTDLPLGILALFAIFALIGFLARRYGVAGFDETDDE